MEFNDRMKNLTGLRYEFRNLARQIISSDDGNDVDLFVANVFKLFDANNDGVLDFEEFVMATSAKGDRSDPREKMEWLFDNVYDKDRSGRLTHAEVEKILTTLLSMENVDVAADSHKEIILDIFREMDGNKDGLVTKREFVEAALSSQLLLRILTSAADREQEARKKDKKITRKSKSRRSRRSK